MTGDDPREFKPVTREDVTDLALLPKRFEFFVAEMRDALRPIAETLIRIDTTLRDLAQRQLELEQRVTALEPPVHPIRRKARRAL